MSSPPGDRARAATAPRSDAAVETSSSWRLTDRIGLGFAWALGLLFCVIAAAIVIYLLVQGIRYVRPNLLVTQPERSDTPRTRRAASSIR